MRWHRVDDGTGCRWIANIDTLAEAKERGEAIERGDLDDQGRPYGDVRLPETEEV
jgi:hypothetical protein